MLVTLGLQCERTRSSSVRVAVFYLNLYYYTGIQTCLQMLVCLDSDDGTQFLVAEPTMTCWDGKHVSYSVTAGIMLFLYAVVYPASVFYLLLVYAPRHGLGSNHSHKVCGFFYRRFMPKIWCWELTEFIKRTTLPVVVSLGAIINPVAQSSIALVSVFVVMVLEVSIHPFRSPLYSTLEEITTVTGEQRAWENPRVQQQL